MKRLIWVYQEQNANPGRSALTLMALTRVPLLVLCVLEGLAVGGAKIPFL